jgi:hypothetical protein
LRTQLTKYKFDFSSLDRPKYDLRVKSYRSDKRQLDAELRKAVERIKQGSDRNELFLYGDGEISVDQV